jgi:tetratricopeptide (TPR) repeat protein
MDAAANWVKRASQHTEALLDAQPEHAEAKALLAGIYGMRIALKPIKGMVLGPRSSRLLDQALELNPNCALAYYHRGTSAYNTPEQWGGSKEAALAAFQRAQQLYEKGNTQQNWEYLNALAWLGISYHALGQYQEAQEIYQQALETAPDFGWVKFVLLPQTEQALASN